MTQRERSAKYVVTCDCDEKSDDPRLWFIALIDDDRAAGGRFHVEALRTVKRSAPNHRGGTVDLYSECGGRCGRFFVVSDTTAAHVLDLIRPAIGKLGLRVRAFPSSDVGAADPVALDAWRARRHAEIATELAGGPRSQPTPMPAPQRHEQRIEIPLRLWCNIISGLDRHR